MLSAFIERRIIMIDIKLKENSQYGGMVVAISDNQEVGWQKFHKDLYEKNRITVKKPEIRYGYPSDIENLLTSFIERMFRGWKYKIEYDYKNIYCEK